MPKTFVVPGVQAKLPFQDQSNDCMDRSPNPAGLLPWAI